MLDYYNQNAKQLVEKYNNLDPDKVHASWRQYLSTNPGLALDVGGGSGRDAAWLSKKGWEVVAVEPAEALFELGQQVTEAYPVTWINDCLPGLVKLQQYRQKFSLILVSAVLMHLSQQQRVESMETLAELMADDSMLVVTIRQGPDSEEERQFHQVPVEELIQFAGKKVFQIEVSNTLSDELERDGVTWQTIIIKNKVLK